MGAGDGCPSQCLQLGGSLCSPVVVNRGLNALHSVNLQPQPNETHTTWHCRATHCGGCHGCVGTSLPPSISVSVGMALTLCFSQTCRVRGAESAPSRSTCPRAPGSSCRYRRPPVSVVGQDHLRVASQSGTRYLAEQRCRRFGVLFVHGAKSLAWPSPARGEKDDNSLAFGGNGLIPTKVSSRPKMSMCL